MKLLEKKQINSIVQAEKKSVIDSGIILATKVDKLRDELLSLQKQRADFIANSKAIIEEALSSGKTEKGILDAEIKEAIKKLAKLREPLDKEWDLLHTQKNAVSLLEKQAQEYVDVLIIDRKKLDSDKEKIDLLKTNIISNEERSARLLQKSEHDRYEIKDLKNAIRTLKANKEIELYKKEQYLDERENDINIREEILKKDTIKLNKEKKLLAIKKQRIR